MSSKEIKDEQDFILPLKDGGIEYFSSDRKFLERKYICMYEIQLSKTFIRFKSNGEDEYSLSEGDVINILLSNISDIITMTEVNFANWLEKKIIKYKGSKQIFNYYEISNRIGDV